MLSSADLCRRLLPTASTQPQFPTPRHPPPPLFCPRSVLRACLPDKGFTAHVIGFTVTAVLDALASRCEVHGHLDGSVALILPLIENDLFGQVGRPHARLGHV
jgi:hypothetical protein